MTKRFDPVNGCVATVEVIDGKPVSLTCFDESDNSKVLFLEGERLDNAVKDGCVLIYKGEVPLYSKRLLNYVAEVAWKLKKEYNKFN